MVNRVAMGLISGSTYGLRVSKAGVNALTANHEDLMFDSAALNTRILATGSIPYVLGDNTARSKITDQIVQLPTIDYEPAVFANPVYRLRTDGSPADPLGGQYFGASSLGAAPIIFEYLRWEYDDSNHRIIFNSMISRYEQMMQSWVSAHPVLHYIIFSNKSS